MHGVFICLQSQAVILVILGMGQRVSASVLLAAGFL